MTCSTHSNTESCLAWNGEIVGGLYMVVWQLTIVVTLYHLRFRPMHT